MKKADAAEETARAAMAMREAQVNLTPGSKLHALVEGRDSPDSEQFLRLLFRTNQGPPPLALSPKVDLQAEMSRMEEAARISMRRRFSSLVATTTIGLLPAAPEPPPSPLPPPDDGRPKISHAMPSDLSQNRLRRTYTLRHEDETKSKKLHAFERKVSSRPLGSELNQLVETGDGHRGISWPRSRIPHLQRQRHEYQTTRSLVPLQKLIDFDNGARALHTPEAKKDNGKAKSSSSRTKACSDQNSDTKDPDEYLRLLFWNNGERKTKAPRSHRVLTKASVQEKLRKLEAHNA